MKPTIKLEVIDGYTFVAITMGKDDATTQLQFTPEGRLCSIQLLLGSPMVNRGTLYVPKENKG